jgi:hypothetical protein
LLSGTVLPFVLPFDDAGPLSQALGLQGYFINGWVPLPVAPAPTPHQADIEEFTR